jgi:hypothetical protein
VLLSDISDRISVTRILPVRTIFHETTIRIKENDPFEHGTSDPKCFKQMQLNFRNSQPDANHSDIFTAIYWLRFATQPQAGREVG